MYPNRPLIALVAVLVFLAVLALQLGAPLSPWRTTTDRAGSGDRLIPARLDVGTEVKELVQPRDGPECDVVIVGAGISGLSAAWELGQVGVRVVVLDMASVFGGHAVMSQGGLSIVGTPMQTDAGVADSPEIATRDFHTWGEDPDADWVRYYSENSRRDIYDWLIELGVEFESVLPSPGNSVARVHQPKGRGIGLVTPIYRQCLRSPVTRFQWNARVIRLLTRDGHVVGVRFRDERTRVESDLQARAVILATGGFQSNLEMVREFWPAEFRFPEKILVGSGLNSVGIGHRVAQEAGAVLTKMDYQWNYFTGIPDPRYPNTNRGLSAANMYGILVNSRGERFANLLNWAKVVMPPLLQEDNATLWFIFDERSKPKFVVSGSDWANFEYVEKMVLKNPDLVSTAETVSELAVKAGLPPERLEATIRRYNQFVDEGEDRDFGRFRPNDDVAIEMSPKIETPPFYAMQAYPLTRKSMGGVAIDLNCRVLDRAGRVIPGLYAVGELTGLALINGKAALEGTFLGPCIVTGRVAGRHVSQSLGKEALGKESPTKPHLARRTCVECHDMNKLATAGRSGFWHFERVHATAANRQWTCLKCHAELAPYRQSNHRIDNQSLTLTCIQCHLAQE